ncbi:hypothetical protein B7L44_07020 [Acinetobacter nosocomialis]|uniref:surface-adhesin E family protein n=1 Tax=Acinetobacter nosocomialis TaxID=106654 RepID=UPI0009E138F7|nr:surface-adhesin E family protein [Acinetobacter nosocomialis]ARG18759.1 hypothetical protein B7L44_07020 [Acinetobacter nosocomialis]
MKKIIFLTAFLASSLSFGADWRYAASTDADSYWVDKSFYKYDSKNNSIDVWSKSVTKKLGLNEFYTKSKSLDKYSCVDKAVKNIAYVEYNVDGSVSKSSTSAASKFTIIFPDSIAESIWEIACSTKGKGFKFSKFQQQFFDASSAEFKSKFE